MKKELLIQGFKISVSFGSGLVRITNNGALKALLSKNLYAGTSELIKVIKDNYTQLYNRPLDISDKSFAVEIWGHLYSEYVSYDLNRLFHSRITERLHRFVAYHCAIIDLGERNRDNNRTFWNMLAFVRYFIAKRLNKKLHKGSYL